MSKGMLHRAGVCCGTLAPPHARCTHQTHRGTQITSDKKFGVKKTKKKGNETLTVKEALLGNGTAANATAGNKTDGRSAVTVVNGDAASKQGRNATRAASGATQLLASAAVGLPSLLLAAVMLL
jgi:hypothetical protein